MSRIRLAQPIRRHYPHITRQNLHRFRFIDRELLYFVHSQDFWPLRDAQTGVLDQALAARANTITLIPGRHPASLVLQEYERLRYVDEAVRQGRLREANEKQQIDALVRSLDDDQTLKSWLAQQRKDYYYVYITRQCNLACTYCFNKGGSLDQAKAPELTPDMARRIADFVIRDSGEQDVVSIALFGGEPLTKLPILEHFMTYADERSREAGKELIYLLDTNGTVWNPKVERLLKSHNVYTMVSIDGPAEYHDPHRPFRDGRSSHRIVAKNAEAMVRAMPGRVGGRAVLASFDYDRVAAYAYLRQFGFNELQVFYHTFSGHGGGASYFAPAAAVRTYRESLEAHVKDMLRELLTQDRPQLDEDLTGLALSRLLRRTQLFRCLPALTYLVVQTDGSLYPCLYMDDSQYCLGHVDTGVTDWDAMRDYVTKYVFHRKHCPKCWARYSCGGCCVARSLAAKGDADRPVPMLCGIMQAEIEAVVYLLSKIADYNPAYLPRLLQSKQSHPHGGPLPWTRLVPIVRPTPA